MAEAGSLVRVSFLGAGRVGGALALAMHRIGWNIQAVASRSADSAAKLAHQVSATTCGFQQAVDAADWVFVTTPDDVIEPLVSALTWRAGQCVLHCSGAQELSVLAAESAHGADVAGFHPLQLIAAAEQGAKALQGSVVAIEAGPASAHRAKGLRDLALALGMQPMALSPGVRPLYHAAANLAASGVLSVLSQATALLQHIGLNEADALHALLPLTRGALNAADIQGLPGAISGPVARGDAGVLSRHLQALQTHAPELLALYQTLSAQQLRLARSNGRLTEAQALQLMALLAGA